MPRHRRAPAPPVNPVNPKQRPVSREQSKTGASNFMKMSAPVRITGKIYDFIYTNDWYCVFATDEQDLYAVPFRRSGDYLVIGTQRRPDSIMLHAAGDSKLRGSEITVEVEFSDPFPVDVNPDTGKLIQGFLFPVTVVAASCSTSCLHELSVTQPQRQLRKRVAAL